MKKILLSVLLVTSLFTIACNNTKAGSKDIKKKSGDDVIVAEYKGGKILKSEFDEEIAKIPAQHREMLLKDESSKKELFKRFVDFKLVFNEIEKTGFKEEHSEDINDQKKRLILEVFKNMKKEELKKETEIADNELKDYYNNNKNEFAEKEQVHAYHILLPDEEGSEKKLKDLKKQIENDEITFEKAAGMNSICPSSKNGGDLSFFGKGAMVAPFEKAAFECEVGEISEPFKTRFGWHIVKVTEKKGGGQKSFEEAKDTIKDKLSLEKQNNKFSDWKEAVLKEKNIEYKKEGEYCSYVNGKPFLKREFVDEELNKQPPYLKAFYSQGENKDKFIEKLTEEKLLADIAVEKYSNFSEENKKSIEQRMEQYLYTIYIREYVNSHSEVEEKDVKDYYEKNNIKYSGNFIYISAEGKTQEELDSLFKEIETKIEKEDFIDLVKKYSDDPSKESGGKLGYFTKDDYPEISASLENIKEGESTGFIKYDNGYVNVKISEAEEVEFDEVEKTFRAKLSALKQKEAFEGLSDELAEKYDLKIYPEKI